MGLLVREGDATGLTEAILLLVKNADLRLKFGSRSRTRSTRTRLNLGRECRARGSFGSADIRARGHPHHGS